MLIFPTSLVIMKVKGILVEIETSNDDLCGNKRVISWLSSMNMVKYIDIFFLCFLWLQLQFLVYFAFLKHFSLEKLCPTLRSK